MAAYQSDDVWAAVADPTRRSILERLARGPCAVGELASGLPISRPAVSQHLRVLRSAGLVSDHAAGTRRFYRLDRAGLDVLRDEIDRFWTSVLDSYQRIVEAEAAAERYAKSQRQQKD
ncbi:winged helix-turn-helix transcriptional regulator [Gordonia sp. TBRC 11910]|uniref:Winged helix-turn-helix transcriptional regulator n=1 Tax=Gordonia asplenii TaxID=2725283 RepID=A0A848KWW2_9ACTN|nr:metalloregulator ArsR/SmtB family transcription factor [Gordonia asplenii]NMO00671.1 winged helix-turn-helix transcriptional regulator [Gordonia asplenii]